MQQFDIGGAKVLRPFQFGTRRLMVGSMLTADEVKSIPIQNRNALVSKTFMVLIPKAAETNGAGKERFLISAGFGNYHVVEGHKITEKALPKAEANKLKNRKV